MTFNEELVELANGNLEVVVVIEVHLSIPNPEHTSSGSVRHDAERTAGRGDAEQNKVPTFRSPRGPTAPLVLQRIINNCSERPFESTKKEKILRQPTEERTEMTG